MGQCKPLVRWRGRTFVEHVVRLAAGAGIGEIVVVQGAWPLRVEWVKPARLVDNPAWTNGPLSSLQAGLRSLRSRFDAILVLSVDRPHLQPEAIGALLEAHRRDPSAVWQPRHAGRRGHPILYPADVAHALLGLSPTDSARTLLARPEIQARRAVVDVDDPAVLDNIDTPADVARLRSTL